MSILSIIELTQRVIRKDQHINELDRQIALLRDQLHHAQRVANDHAQDAARWQCVRSQGHLAYRLLANSRDKDADQIVDKMRSGLVPDGLEGVEL
ncbi:hypothetical protein KLER11_gp43 [Pararheinheimera phage vB_PsoM_KLER1-1]|nr:hypothetical protein KLER11_gp43 [Pararheinheimera phage vB_PsoM_KLER1-1]